MNPPVCEKIVTINIEQAVKLVELNETLIEVDKIIDETKNINKLKKMEEHFITMESDFSDAKELFLPLRRKINKKIDRLQKAAEDKKKQLLTAYAEFTIICTTSENKDFHLFCNTFQQKNITDGNHLYLVLIHLCYLPRSIEELTEDGVAAGRLDEFRILNENDKLTEQEIVAKVKQNYVDKVFD